jgi:hypothetical protein
MEAILNQATGLNVYYVLAVVTVVGFLHAFEPDYLTALRLTKDARNYALFGLSHGIRFALIAVPLVALFSGFAWLAPIGDIIVLLFAFLPLYFEIRGVELKVSPKGSGLLQGAFALTPSKLLVVILASELGLFLGLVSVVLFVSISIPDFVIAVWGSA